MALFLVVLPLSTLASPYQARSFDELPVSAFPALYYWSQNHGRGFGPFSASYRYGAHPGYNRVTNYFKDLDNGNGFLVEHVSALLTIFAESEAHALATCCGYWQDLRGVQRVSPLNVAVSGGFGHADAGWDADVWYRTTKSVQHVQRYAEWNFMLYSGRACPDKHDLWELHSPAGLEEYFCAVADGRPDRDLNLGDPSCAAHQAAPSIATGNPVHIASGNKFQREPVISAPGNRALHFDWFYNSQTLGRAKWTHTYSRALKSPLATAFDNADEVSRLPRSRFVSIEALRPDGRVLRFGNVLDWQAGTTRNPTWSGRAGTGAELLSLADPESGRLVGLLLRTAQGEEERYALDGRLIYLTRSDGQELTMRYDSSGRLDRVTDTSGRSIRLGYTNALLTEVNSPDGASYHFEYTGQGTLSRIVFPDASPSDPTDNPRRTLHYEDVRFPAHLTGVTDELGSRVSSWTYDDRGRAVSSVHAGDTDRHTLVFNADGTTTVTDPLGHAQTYRFVTLHGVTRIASISDGECAQCGPQVSRYAYGAEGFLVTETDADGITTSYVRDALGRELSRTEASGRREARNVVTRRDERSGKPLSVTAPGRITTYAYDAQGRLRSTSVVSPR